MYSSKHRLHKQFDPICRFFHIFASIVLKYSKLEFGKSGSAFVCMLLIFLGTISMQRHLVNIYTHMICTYIHTCNLVEGILRTSCKGEGASPSAPSETAEHAR